MSQTMSVVEWVDSRKRARLEIVYVKRKVVK